jgi:hypothetical protein
MIAGGVLIVRNEEGSGKFHPPASAWWISGLASFVVLYTFMRDTDATLHSQVPQPYLYGLFVPAIVLYLFAMALAFKTRSSK